MRTRYVFQVWAGTPVLSSYSVLEARIGSLRLLVPSSGSYGLHLLAILTLAFGYLGGFILVVASPFYQEAAPRRNPWVSTSIVLAFTAGFFILLFWEERSILHWTLRYTSRHPRRLKAVQAYTIKPGTFFQEILAVVDGQDMALKVEGSLKNVQSALRLARITVSQKEARRVTLYFPGQEKGRALLGGLSQRLSRTSVNIAGVGFLVFAASMLSLYVWLLTQEPLNWVWVAGLLLSSWMAVMIVRVVLKGRRFYCYNCDGYEVFFRKQGEWRCHRCGQSTAV